MACARGLSLLAAALAATAGWAASPCEEARERTGLALAAKDGVLTVMAVDDGSAAASSGVRAGDVVVQVNAVVPRTCGEYARAVKEAEEERKALLFLVRRTDAEVPLALGSRTWGAEPGEDRGLAAILEPSAPSRRAAPESPPLLPADTLVSVDSVLGELGALVAGTRAGFPAYRDRVGHARRAVETLGARHAAPPDTVTVLRDVARLHEAAVVAWQAMETIRERDGIPRRLPISEALAAPYFSGSPEEVALDEFEFLRDTIVQEPHPGRFTESSGEWRPVPARRLLWEHAGEALGRATATIAGAP